MSKVLLLGRLLQDTPTSSINAGHSYGKHCTNWLIGLHNESLTESIKDENVLRQFIAEPPSTPKQKATFKAILMAKGKSSNIATEVTEGLDTCTGFLTEDNNQRMKRAFVHLEAYCMTPDAKKSLWEWQLRYARLEQNEKLLPVGGKMSENGSWVRRMGKAFAGSKFSGSKFMSLSD